RNTVLLGLGAGVAGALAYAMVGYTLLRVAFRGRAVMDFLTWLPWSLPGILLGLAFLWVFLGSGPLLLPLYGTLQLLILVIVVKGLPLGVQLIKTSIAQVQQDLEEGAWMAGASRLATLRRVVLPILAPSVVAVGLITVIEAVREIPAMVFLGTATTRPLALLTLDYLNDSEFERASIVGLLTVALVIVAALAGRALGVRLTVRAAE
ncbi:MAG TPA: ABC transporter permease subunit, partial [Chloroflexota bacterium]|nr:ABC transporter permease subunit [Chloroflexota bacterium]